MLKYTHEENKNDDAFCLGIASGGDFTLEGFTCMCLTFQLLQLLHE
jgi:hypothetical protein